MFTALIVKAGTSRVCCLLAAVFRFKLAQLPQFHYTSNRAQCNVRVWCPAVGWLSGIHLMPMIQWSNDTQKGSVQSRSEPGCDVTPRPGTRWRIPECSSSLMYSQHFVATRQQLIVRTRKWKDAVCVGMLPLRWIIWQNSSEVEYWSDSNVCFYGSWKSR